MNILHEIFSHKKKEVEARQAQVSELQLLDQFGNMPLPPNFSTALTNQAYPAPRLIAEVKHKSPSKGVLRQDFDPLALASTYVENGAQAISVLTDERYFGGSMAYLHDIHQRYPEMPLLCKDFIYTSYQLLEAQVNGASAALLIVAMLSQVNLVSLIAYALDIGLTPLVEVHDELEFRQAVESGAQVIGVNNRNLNDFTVNLETSFRLAKYRSEDIVLVSESGIKNLDDVRRLGKAGIDAMLIGESLVVEKEPGEKVRELARVVTKGVAE